MDWNFIFHLQNMLFPFPLELFPFPFPFPLVAQNYSHSHGNPMGIPIPIPMHTSTAAQLLFVSWAQIRRGSVSAARRHHSDDHLRQHGARLQPAGARLPRLTGLRRRQEDCHQLTRSCPVPAPFFDHQLWPPCVADADIIFPLEVFPFH